MNLTEAQAIAEQIKNAMRPYCERIEIGGSIRRKKPDNIKDVEIVAIPKWHDGQNLLHAWAESDEALLDTPITRWLKPGVKDAARISWDATENGKYWKGELVNGAALDVFIAVPENWGYILLLRTGSAEFGEAVLTHAKRRGLRFKDGFLTDGNEETPTRIETPEEEAVFERLGLRYVTPEERTSKNHIVTTLPHGTKALE